jgi:molybdenum cofactor cytidylyltransferase
MTGRKRPATYNPKYAMFDENRGSGVSAIVLAAGMSRRMGSPKQLLRLDDKPLLEHTLESVRKSRVSEIILVLGFAADEVKEQISLAQLKAIENPGYEGGMGTSLRTGLAAIDPNARAALIVLADQPFVQPETLDTLVEYHSTTSAQIVIPTFNGFRGNPVLLDRAVFPELRGLSGDVGCRAIFGSHTEGIHKVPVNDPGILLDVDSREDLERFRKAASSARRAQSTLPLLESRPDVPKHRPELLLVGRDAVVDALASFGQLLQFTVTLVDPFLRLAELSQADRVLHALDFSHLPPAPERYAVVASRGQFDEEALAEALKAGISYVALMANRKRAQELAASLRAQGFVEQRLSAIRAPAGLNIGAENPEEIALSIMAEIVAERKSRK